LAQYDVNLREYWRILKKRKFIVILTAVAVGVLSTGFALLKAPPPIYSAVCSVKFEKETTVEGLYTKTLSWSVGSDIETQASIIESYSVFEAVAQRLGLIKKAPDSRHTHLKAQAVRIVDDLQSRVKVTRQENTNLLNIEVQDKDPAFAQKLANTLAETYKDLHSENQMKRTAEAIKYINDQLSRVKQQLKESEETFNTFSKNNQFISFDMQSETLVARAHEIRVQTQELQGKKLEFEGILKRLKQFAQSPNGSAHDFYSQRANTQYQQTSGKLVDLLLERDTLLKDFTRRHPDVLAINNRIVENALKLAYLLQLQIRGIESEVAERRQELERVEEKAKGLLDEKLEYDRLKRSVDSYNDMMALLEQKQQEAMIRMAEKPEEVTIVKPAILPISPINPPKTAATGGMGILIGFVLGLVVAFVVETFDTSLGAIEDVEATLETEVIGIIPHGDYHHVREDLKDKFGGKITEKGFGQAMGLITHLLPKSMVSESFRALRTNVLFRETEEKTKAFAVTSTAPEEGKTFVAANLGITMAQAGMKTLLVGSDLRRPMLARMFGLERSPGLSDILVGNCRWRDTVKTLSDMVVGNRALEDVTVTAGLENLHIITRGSSSPNPTELLNSKRLDDFMEEVKQHYDIIIFDSSPILSTADAVVLGTKVDGVLLTYRVGAVSRGLLKRATTQLRQVNCRIMGVVLNGMKPDVSPDFHGYKYYHYYYTQRDENKGQKKRGKRNGFPFFKRKNGGSGGPGIEGSGIWSRKERKHRPDVSRLSIFLIAFAFLAGASLGHKGFIDSLKKLRANAAVEDDNAKAVVRESLPKQHDDKAAFQKMIILPIPVRPKPSPNPDPLSLVSVSESEVSSEENVTLVAEPIFVEEEEALALTAPTREEDSSHSGPPKPVQANLALKTPPKKEVVREASPSVNPVPPPKPAGKRGTKEPVSVAETYAAKPMKPDGKVSKKRESQEKPKALVSLAEKPAPPRKAAGPLKSKQIQDGHALYPYSVRLSVCHTVGAAKDVVDSYKKRDIEAYWVKVNLEKGVRFRVFTGHFSSQGEASRFSKEKHLRGCLVQKTPYSAQVGTYADGEEELHKKIQSLRQLDCSPYTIMDRDGKCRLYVGAFITPEGGEEQQQELASLGIKSRMVKR
jgi:succinoglycan biosynthesis transport protein ExoP